VLGYYVLISVLGRIAPYLRQAVLIPFNLVVVALMFVSRGPHLLSLRRAGSADVRRRPSAQ
jgi:hypothetical protein